MSSISTKTVSVYMGKAFARFARKARINEIDLWHAAQQANTGLVDADLGGGVVKQRLARAGQGKSGGSRSIILLKKDDRAVYVFGFEKKDKANIDRRELEAFRELAEVILGYTAAEMEERVRDGALSKVREPGGENA